MNKVYILKVNPDRPEKGKIEEAVKTINKGGVVVFPTDTVYGIGAGISQLQSIKKIYKIKKRQKNKPIVYLIGYKKDVKRFVRKISPEVRTLIRKFWPGPLTLIFKFNSSGKEVLLGKNKTIGVRMPGHKVALALLKKAGPIATTSANISGRRNADKVANIEDRIKRKADLVIAGGKSRLGKESTVLDVSVSPFRILREGYIKKTDIIMPKADPS